MISLYYINFTKIFKHLKDASLQLPTVQWVDTNPTSKNTGDGEVLELKQSFTNLRGRELLV